MQQAKRLTRTTYPVQISFWDWNLVVISAGLLLILITVWKNVAFLTPLRVVLGLLHALYVPGYCLTTVLFPHRRDIGLVTRTALSFGLSAALIPLFALLLDKLPWGITLEPIIRLLAIWILGFCMASMWRRWKLAPVGKAYVPPVVDSQVWWQTLLGPIKPSFALAGLLAITLVLGAAFVLVPPAMTIKMTEFYILGKEGLASHYPRQVRPNEDVTVTMGIANQEAAAHRYRVEILAIDPWDPQKQEVLKREQAITLQPGETKEWPVSWQMPWIGDDQKVEFRLFLDDGTHPYRELRLWINVGDEQGE